MTTQELIKKYTTYRDNVQWHIERNKLESEGLRRCQQKMEDYNKVIKYLESLQEDNDNFTMAFVVWALYDPQAQAWIKSGITTYDLLQKYRDRPFIDNSNPQLQ